MADRMDRLGRLYVTRFCLTRLAGAQVYLRGAPLVQKRLHTGISVNGRICCFTELKTQTRLLHNDFRQTSSLKCQQQKQKKPEMSANRVVSPS